MYGVPMVEVRRLFDECLSRYGLLENYTASVTGTGTRTTLVTVIALLHFVQ